MDNINLKNLIKDNTVHFSFLRESSMYYTIDFEGGTYQFEVPLNEVGNGVMNREDKAIYYMRWIRKAKEKSELFRIT